MIYSDPFLTQLCLNLAASASKLRKLASPYVSQMNIISNNHDFDNSLPNPFSILASLTIHRHIFILQTQKHCKKLLQTEQLADHCRIQTCVWSCLPHSWKDEGNKDEIANELLAVSGTIVMLKSEMDELITKKTQIVKQMNENMEDNTRRKYKNAVNPVTKPLQEQIKFLQQTSVNWRIQLRVFSSSL